MKQENPDLPAAAGLGERYEISRRLREEPWGMVWLARDRLLGADVGLKVLSRESPEHPAAQGYYQQEAALALRLRHPKVLGALHLEATDEALFLVQEPFDGESLLAQFSRQQRFSLPQAMHILEQVGQALAFAHQRGVVHHGLNPGNILLKGEEVRLANFAFPRQNGVQVTTLELKAYDAPEVIYGDVPTEVSNIFSLGVLAFRLVAGSLPYALTFDEPFPYRVEALPADLGEVPLPLQNPLLRCLAVDPEERFPDVASFLAQLRQVREVKSRGRGEDYQGWNLEKDGDWQPAASRVGAVLGSAWPAVRPLVQKSKEAALRAGGAFMDSPRRLLWGLGLAGLVVLLIWAGTSLNRKTPEAPKLAAVAPQKPAAAPVGVPPLMESAEPAASRGQLAAGPAPAALAPAPSPGPLRGAAPEQARAKEERFLLVVGTYADQKQAQALEQKLKKDNFKARVTSRTSGGTTQYQVQVGPVTGSKAAEDLAQRLKTKEKITPRIVKMSDTTKSTKPTAKTAARRPAR